MILGLVVTGGREEKEEWKGVNIEGWKRGGERKVEGEELGTRDER